MVRFVIDAVQSERATALEKLGNAYQQTLRSADSAFARHLAARTDPITPREVHAFYRDLLDRAVIIRVATPEGQPLTGWNVPGTSPIAYSSLKDFNLPMQVQIYLLDQSVVESGVKDQVSAY